MEDLVKNVFNRSIPAVKYMATANAKSSAPEWPHVKSFEKLVNECVTSTPITSEMETHINSEYVARITDLAKTTTEQAVIDNLDSMLTIAHAISMITSAKQLFESIVKEQHLELDRQEALRIQKEDHDDDAASIALALQLSEEN